MDKKLKVSSNPHVRDGMSTRGIMLAVIIALLPTTIFGIINFGYHALLVILVSVGFAVLAEFVMCKILKKPVSVGDCSAIVTGLLLALSLRKEGGSITLIPPVESRSYIDMTIQAMREFNVEVDWEDEYVLRVNPGQMYLSQNIEVEGDYSNAAFLDAFNFLGGNVEVTGLNDDSLQGDQVYKEYFKKLENGKAVIDIADCPDLGPVLFAVAAATHGGVFTSTARLKIKESDRGRVMCQELAKFGVNTKMVENQVEIDGGGLKIPSEILCGHNDHRIVMSLSLLLTQTGGKINDAETVRKSYPGFFDDIAKLGVIVE